MHSNVQPSNYKYKTNGELEARVRHAHIYQTPRNYCKVCKRRFSFWTTLEKTHVM